MEQIAFLRTVYDFSINCGKIEERNNKFVGYLISLFILYKIFLEAKIPSVNLYFSSSCVRNCRRGAGLNINILGVTHSSARAGMVQIRIIRDFTMGMRYFTAV